MIVTILPLQRLRGCSFPLQRSSAAPSPSALLAATRLSVTDPGDGHCTLWSLDPAVGGGRAGKSRSVACPHTPLRTKKLHRHDAVCRQPLHGHAPTVFFLPGSIPLLRAWTQCVHLSQILTRGTGVWRPQTPAAAVASRSPPRSLNNHRLLSLSRCSSSTRSAPPPPPLQARFLPVGPGRCLGTKAVAGRES